MRRLQWHVIAISVIAALMTSSATYAQTEENVRGMMNVINEQLDSEGENVRLSVVEFYTASGREGQTVFFDDSTKQLGLHWVPGDPRRGGFMDISWLSDQVDGMASGLTLVDTQTAVDNAMATWDNVNCSVIPLVQLDDFGMDWGYAQWIVGMGGTRGWSADITHAGWMPSSFFDLVWGPGGGASSLGVTFTFVWLDNSGYPTDIDQDGKLDVSFREIYYNNDWPWGIDTHYPIDVETIVLHETGHGLSQGHFGKLFMTHTNGKAHFAPQAVMNAVYSDPQQTLTGTDKGGHCSIWSRWPN